MNTRLRTITLGLLVLAITGASAAPPMLEALGYQTLRINGKLALGTRPLLVVLIDAEGSGLEFPPDHNLEYYRTNIFDVSGAQTVCGFLLENSSGRFSFSQNGHSGVIGPVALPSAERYPPTLVRAGHNIALADLLFHSNLLARTMMSGLMDFAPFNTDANPDITADELQLLFIFNEAGSGGAARYAGRVQPPGFAYGLNVGLDAGVSFPTPFDTLTHELTHTLGAFDLYGPNCLGLGLTLMSCTSLTPDGRQTFHLDPWHKLKLGWCEPRIRALGSNGVETLWAGQMMRPDAQVVLYDPARGTTEYFILEYRTRTSPNGAGYDRDVAGSGLVIWQVKQGEPPPGLPGVFTLGFPNLARGGNAVWSGGMETLDLVWTDGLSTRTRLVVQPFAPGAGSIMIEWRVGADTEPAPPPPGPGYALEFDGVDEYLAAAPPAIPSGNSPYTIEAWIKPSSMNAGGIVAWGNYANNQVNAFVLTPAGLINYWWGNDLTAPTPNLIGNWHHVAATFDGGTRRIFLDGVQAGIDVPAAPPGFAPTDFRIGLANAGQYFNGQMDEVRVWNVARSATQLQEAMRHPLGGNEAGLVGYWRFDEGSGLNALDATGRAANRAVLVSGPEWVVSTITPFAPQSIPPYGPGSALDFDGVNDHLTATPDNLPTGNSAYTIEAWMRPNLMHVGAFAAWGIYSDPPNRVNAFVLDVDGLVNYWWGNDLKLLTTNLAGAWHHVAATFDGTTRRILLNGVSLTNDTPVGHAAMAANFRIGLANAGQYFNGRLDEVRLWNVARTTNQIQEVMRRQLWGNEPGLVAYWRFDEAGVATPFDVVNNLPAVMVGGVTRTPSTLLPFAPTVTPQPPVPGAVGTVTLNGTAIPNNATSFGWFEWGLTTAYGNATSAQPLGNGTSPANWSAVLTGLTPGVRYHGRAVATNLHGASYGSDLVFGSELTNLVTHLGDSGPGSLRAALLDPTHGVTTIAFAPNVRGTIFLTSGELVVSRSVRILGPGPRFLIISGNNASRVFATFPNTSVITLDGLTIRDGLAVSPLPLQSAWGGAILNKAVLTVSNCVFTGNRAVGLNGAVGEAGSAAQGGAIYNRHQLVLVNSTFMQNRAQGGAGGDGANNTLNPGQPGGFAWGGAIYADQPIAVLNCTFATNTAAGGDGGCGGFVESLDLNGPGGAGGAAGGGHLVLDVAGATNHLVHATLAGGHVQGGAGGYGETGAGTGPVGAASAGGVWAMRPNTRVLNTLLARNTLGPVGVAANGPDALGTILSAGHNLVSATNGSTGWVVSDLTGSAAAPRDPKLGTFGLNFGITPNFALQTNSPAVNAGDDASLASPWFLATDQRGFPRRSAGRVDIGAYELCRDLPAFEVTTLDDARPGSLRAAIECAAPGGTITFAPGLAGTIVLSPNQSNAPMGELVIDKDLTIVGPGADRLAISGRFVSRVFRIDSGQVRISGLTIRDGYVYGVWGADATLLTPGGAGEDASGGGILNLGDLTLSDCMVTTNTVFGGLGGAGAGTW